MKGKCVTAQIVVWWET